MLFFDKIRSSYVFVTVGFVVLGITFFSFLNVSNYYSYHKDKQSPELFQENKKPIRSSRMMPKEGTPPPVIELGDTSGSEKNTPLKASPSTYIKTTILKHIMMVNPDLGEKLASYIADCIVYYSYQHGLDPLVMTALFTQESRFRPSVVSHAGAVGIGQLMPSTANGLGVSNPYDIAQNIDGSCRYFAIQLKRYTNRTWPVELALAAYNAGPGAVEEYGGFPPYRETQNYIVSVRNIYFQLSENLTSQS